MKLDFLHWLATRPIDFYTAKQLMRLWSTQTNRFFDSDDYNFISRIRSL